MDYDSSSSSSSDESSEDSDNDGRGRRKKIFRKRQNFNLFDLTPRFRFSRAGMDRILERIRPMIAHNSDRNMALSPEHQLALALRYLGGTGFMLTVGDAHGPSKATVSRTVHRVVQAINDAYFDEVIRWPDDAADTIVKFYKIAGMPSVIGAVDGTYIPIKKPKIDEHQYINRKNQSSINTMMVAGPDLRFLYVSARWPGSVHDARILRSSTLAQRFNAGWRPDGAPANSVLLGDSAYGLSEWMITPMPEAENLTPVESRFLRAHRRTRQVVECAYGVLKRRFACLKELRLDPVFSCEVIKTCTVLHNLSIIDRPLDPDEIEEAMQLMNDNELLQNNDNVVVHGADALGLQRRLQIMYHFA